MKKELYVLRILDSEDEFCYEILVYDNKKDYWKANEIIKQFDDDFHNREDVEYANWYEELIEVLKKEKLLGYKVADTHIAWVR